MTHLQLVTSDMNIKVYYHGKYLGNVYCNGPYEWYTKEYGPTYLTKEAAIDSLLSK